MSQDDVVFSTIVVLCAKFSSEFVEDVSQVAWSTISNCVGGIALDNSDALIRQCIIRNNQTTENGAGVLIADSSPLIRNSLIVSNVTQASGGGLFIDTGSNPTGVNCTVADNVAVGTGGGLHSEGFPTFRNMIVWGNSSSNTQNVEQAGGFVQFKYSDVEGSFVTHGVDQNITNNPVFMGGGGTDHYELQATSPCKDKGTFYLALVIDLNGNWRPSQADFPDRVDVGCYEFGAAPHPNPGPLSVLGSVEINPQSDIDGDGFTYAQEQALHTDAESASSRFMVDSQQSVEANTVRLGWETVSGCEYTVQTCDDLVAGNWVDVDGYTNLSGDGEMKTYEAALPETACYYRVRVKILN